MKPSLLLSLALAFFAAPASSEDYDAREFFIEANLRSTYYHELGHALIDVLQLPVLGREEDAADSLSTMLMHELWEGESANAMMDSVALGWLWADAWATQEGYEPAYWDSHSLDLQRYYTQLCLFYGADAENRKHLIERHELPEDRASGCEWEYYQVAQSWAKLLEVLDKPGDGEIAFVKSGSKYDSILEQEVNDFNRDYNLPVNIKAGIEPCGEANAFYDPGSRRIIMCSEYIEHIGGLWDAN